MDRRGFLISLAAAAGLSAVPAPVRRFWQVPSNAPYSLRGPIVGKHIDYLVVDDPFAGSPEVSQAHIRQMVEHLRAQNVPPNDDGGYLVHLPVETAKLLQNRTLERSFHDALYPNLLFREVG